MKNTGFKESAKKLLAGSGILLLSQSAIAPLVQTTNAANGYNDRPYTVTIETTTPGEEFHFATRSLNYDHANYINLRPTNEATSKLKIYCNDTLLEEIDGRDITNVSSERVMRLKKCMFPNPGTNHIKVYWGTDLAYGLRFTNTVPQSSQNYNNYQVLTQENRDKIKRIELSDGKILLEREFESLRNLEEVTSPTVPDLQYENSLIRTFYDTPKLRRVENIEKWNTSQITSMANTFTDAKLFNQSLGEWQAGKVTHIGEFIQGATSFNQPLPKTWTNIAQGGNAFRQTPALSLGHYANFLENVVDTRNTSTQITGISGYRDYCSSAVEAPRIAAAKATLSGRNVFISDGGEKNCELTLSSTITTVQPDKKIVTATGNRPHDIFHTFVDGPDFTCNNTIDARLTEGRPNDPINTLTFGVEAFAANNGQKVCFRGVDRETSQVVYHVSPLIDGIKGDGPRLTTGLTPNGPTKAKEKEATAQVDKPSNVEYSEPTNSPVCDATVPTGNATRLAVGDTLRMPIKSESANGKRICVKATDDHGNTTYEFTPVIEGVDTTPLDLNVPKVGNTLVPAVTGDDGNPDTYKYYPKDNPANKKPFTSGTPIDITPDMTGKTFVFEAEDEAGNKTTKEVPIDRNDPPVIELEKSNPLKTITPTVTDTDLVPSSLKWNIEGEPATTDKPYVNGQPLPLTEDMNGKRLVFKAEDEGGNKVSKTSDILNGIDNTAPKLDVQNPDKLPAKEKDVTATTPDPDATITHAVLPPNSTKTCDDPSLVYKPGSAVKFTKESDNGSKVCFKAKDPAGNETTKVSDPIDGIDNTPPRLDVTNPPKGPAKEKDVTANSDPDATITHAVIPPNSNLTCDDPSLIYKPGNTVKFTKESENGSKVCFKAKDPAGNETTKVSDPITGIDNTPPEIELDRKGNNLTPTVTDDDLDEDTLFYHIEDKPTEKKPYKNGQPVPLTEDMNGKRLIFEASDKGGNKATKPSDILTGIDNTPPVIELTKPTKTITPTVTDDNLDNNSLEYYIEGKPNEKRPYINNHPVTLTPDMNGKKLVFVARDLSGNETSKDSDIISGIGTDSPIITLDKGKLEITPTVKDDNLDPTKNKFYIEGNPNDKKPYESGKPIPLTKDMHGKKLVFEAEDLDGNKGSAISPVIDIQAPEITLTRKGDTLTPDVVDDNLNPNSLFYYIEGKPTEKKPYKNGEPIQLTPDMNGKRLIFEAKDFSENEAEKESDILKGIGAGSDFDLTQPDNTAIVTPKNKDSDLKCKYHFKDENPIVKKDFNLTTGLPVTKEMDKKILVVECTNPHTGESTTKELPLTYKEPSRGGGGGGGSAPTKIEIKKDCRVVGNCDEPKKEEPKKEEPKVEPTPVVDDSFKDYNGVKYKNDDTDRCPRIVKYSTASTSSSFEDIYDSYAKEYIGKFYNVDVVRGTSLRTFEPSRNIDRAEFLAIVLKAHCIEPSEFVNPGDIPFTDVDLNTWEARVIKKAYEIGIISGYQPIDGKVLVKPKTSISKIEALAVLTKMKNVVLDNSKNYSHNFTDLKAEWQNQIATIAQKLDLVSDNVKLNPDVRISREWMMETMNNLVNRYNEISK